MPNLLGQSPVQKTDNMRGTATERRYFAWLATWGQCCVSGRLDFDLAHTGGTGRGKGMGRKSHLSTVLPLARPLHVVEEQNRELFWARIGIPDRLDWAARLYDIFEAGDDPTSLFLDMQGKADRGFMAGILADLA